MSTAGHLAEWNEATGGISMDTAELRATLVREEAREVEQAILHEGIAEIAKELADLVYIAYGAASYYDIDLDACLAEVHRSNMTKVKGGLRLREDGKVLKGPHYEEADITSVIGGTVDQERTSS